MNTAPMAGKVAIVTGASGNLGGAICDAFVRSGAIVVGVDINGGDPGFQFDLSTATGNQAMIDAVVERHGRLDILVLNAARQHVATLADCTDEGWDSVLDIGLRGPFQAMRAAWPHLLKQTGSRIVATASTSSFVAAPEMGPYIAAKHGLMGLVRTAALEGAPHGLTVNAVAPGWMESPISGAGRVDNEHAYQLMLEDSPARRYVAYQEVAEAIRFLASDGASGISGTCLPVDLGALVK
jgi:3-hydroxybutyrate dehydrogenase